MPKTEYEFNREFQTKWPCFKDGRNEDETEYIICLTSTSVANKGSYDLEAHINIAKHKKQIFSCQITQRPVNFLLNKIQEHKNG
jgi:hypothetical protein